jgi:hypothetical protein
MRTDSMDTGGEEPASPPLPTLATPAGLSPNPFIPQEMVPRAPPPPPLTPLEPQALWEQLNQLLGWRFYLSWQLGLLPESNVTVPL